ncbi:hypothetical protein BXZ70DRAFT_908285 [Cristinia sonorae]|uniref:Uncharacterized protein n=1 Tax=Cristinia sonorae TaxID=1940300 RepID=A0A8K0XNH6_9AGAR|nr:hypothetical protein BXZ70DRAFT_908285 [Cristinia sonorae]
MSEQVVEIRLPLHGCQPVIVELPAFAAGPAGGVLTLKFVRANLTPADRPSILSNNQSNRVVVPQTQKRSYSADADTTSSIPKPEKRRRPAQYEWESSETESEDLSVVPPSDDREIELQLPTSPIRRSRTPAEVPKGNGAWSSTNGHHSSQVQAEELSNLELTSVTESEPESEDIGHASSTLSHRVTRNGLIPEDNLKRVGTSVSSSSQTDSETETEDETENNGVHGNVD